MVGVNAFPCKPKLIDKCSQPKVAAPGTDAFQALSYNNAVFAHKLHDVAYSRNGGKFQKLKPLIILKTVELIYLLDKLPCSHGTAAFLKRISAFPSLNIHHSKGSRQNFIALLIRTYTVMVSYNNLHSKLIGLIKLFNSCNTVITGQYQLYIILGRLLYYIHVDAVAVIYSVRYAAVDICAYIPKTLQQNICRADAVNVVIPHNTNALTCPYSFINCLCRPLHIRHEQPVIKLSYASMKKILNFLITCNISVSEYSCHNLVNAEFLGNMFKISFFCINVPITHLLSPVSIVHEKIHHRGDSEFFFAAYI